MKRATLFVYACVALGCATANDDVSGERARGGAPPPKHAGLDASAPPPTPGADAATTTSDAGPARRPTADAIDTPCLGTPDPDIAVSPGLVGVAIQWHAYFYTKDGALDHGYAWSALRGNLVGDAHIVYDVASARWLLSTIVDLGGGSFGVQMMVSTDASASAWKVSIPITAPMLLDNPEPSVTKDKVVVTSGACVWVLDKDALMSATIGDVMPATCSIQKNNQVVAAKQAGAPSSTAYAITMSDAQTLNWISIDGTPGAGDVVVREHPIAVDPVQAPAVTQFGATIESGEVLAMTQGGHIVWAKSTTCASGSCTRWYDVDTASGAVASHELSMPGLQLFYGVPGFTRAGDVFVLAAAADPNGPVSLALARPSAPPAIVAPGSTMLSGTRFGDFFSAAQDPDDGSLWLFGEYAGPEGSPLDPEGPAACKVVHVGNPQ